MPETNCRRTSILPRQALPSELRVNPRSQTHLKVPGSFIQRPFLHILSCLHSSISRNITVIYFKNWPPNYLATGVFKYILIKCQRNIIMIQLSKHFKTMIKKDVSRHIRTFTNVLVYCALETSVTGTAVWSSSVLACAVLTASWKKAAFVYVCRKKMIGLWKTSCTAWNTSLKLTKVN